MKNLWRSFYYPMQRHILGDSVHENFCNYHLLLRGLVFVESVHSPLLVYKRRRSMLTWVWLMKRFLRKLEKERTVSRTGSVTLKFINNS